MFEKASLRTRLSFEAGMNAMGGNCMFVDQTNSPLGERESISDVARNVERWVDVIVLRTYAHDTITEMAANARVPVINALSDFEHPCQALADALSQDGYAAAAGPAPAPGNPVLGNAGAGMTKAAAVVDNGEQICQHHCPVAHVAAEFPQLCEAETEAFGRLLGTPVRRLATIAHGDGICTTHVTSTSRPGEHPTSPEGSHL